MPQTIIYSRNFWRDDQLPSLSAENLNNMEVGIENLYTLFYTHQNSTLFPHPDGAITTSKIASGAITTDLLANESVTLSKLSGNLQLSSSYLQDGSVTITKLAVGAVTGNSIALGTLTTSLFAAGAVTNTVIADSAVTTSKIADGAITSSKIADGSVTASKLSISGIAAYQIANGTALGQCTNTVIVSSIGGEYNTLSSALAGINPTFASPYTILVVGPINETTQIVAKSYTTVIGINGNIKSTYGNAAALVINGNIHTVFKDLEFIRQAQVTGTNAYMIDIKNSNAEFDNCSIENASISSSNSNTINISQNSVVYINDSIVDGEFACNNSSTINIADTSSLIINDSSIEPAIAEYPWIYSTANTSFSLVNTSFKVKQILVSILTPRNTQINIGVGSDIAYYTSSLDISTTGLKQVTLINNDIQSSEIVVTPANNIIQNGDIVITVLYQSYSNNSPAMNIDTTSKVIIDNCTVKTSNNNCINITNNGINNLFMKNCYIEAGNLGTPNYSITAAATYDNANIFGCILVGNMNNITAKKPVVEIGAASGTMNGSNIIY